MASPFDVNKKPVIVTDEHIEQLAPVDVVKGGEIKEQNEITLDQVGDHMRMLNEHALTYAGKPGYNPFLWEQKVLRPLQKEVQENPSQELFARIMAMEKTEPKI